MIELRSVRYKLHTLILVLLLAFTIGAGSRAPLSEEISSEGAEVVISGFNVKYDSDKRRVKKSVEACLYVLDIWEFARRKEEVDCTENGNGR